MAQDAAIAVGMDNDAFRRGERVIVVVGGAAFGLVGGVIAALALGRVGLWPLAVGAPFYLLALYLSCATLHDALERRAYGCAAVAVLVTAAMFAWPIAAALALPLWSAPITAMAAMVLLASCWVGTGSAVYRLGAEAAIVGAVAAYLGAVSLLS